MCTVTFIPTRNSVLITSNRDEKLKRSPAIPPRKYRLSNGNILFPRDADAGGTWICAHENGNAVVLLNGGFHFHQSNPPYRRSRGLILLDMANDQSPHSMFSKIDLDGIEPFTLVIWEAGQLFECRWDGSTKHHRTMDASTAHIWSSVTLYDDATMHKRERWFSSWLHERAEIEQEDILHFHQFTGDGDAHNDLNMNRPGCVQTVSVTSVLVGDEQAIMTYLDLRNGERHEEVMMLEKTLADR